MTNSPRVKCAVTSLVFLLSVSAALQVSGQTLLRQAQQALQAQQETEYYTIQPDGSRVVQSRPATARRAAAIDPRQELLFTIERILNDQASLGQNRNNNPIIADLERLVAQHTVKKNSTVTVTNLGPGTLEIRNNDGTYSDLQPHARTDVEVGTNKIQLTAIYSDTSIRMEHRRNGPARFWDGDDRRYTPIDPDNRITKWPPRTHRAHLTHGFLGYHLEQ
ncbi:hypothetical protein [Adhaeretor mobilis]|uniref:Uncharacterized protein n=1 Tax=Adhaeretor mobilis TaxID=1930276 RepID=A0A517MS97_9BACT|nr:hypothetical protein [Adhaeretor mobilis]QDS97657.1 hypothetical protein HG15A2_09210 [Adhaeretor mobilis]